MGTGRLSISRGHQLQGGGHLALVPAVAAEPAPPPSTPDYLVVHDRLTALERLTRLHEQGALSAEEFAAEKRLILGLPADELLLSDPAPVHFVPAAPRRPARGPSLIGRMLNWKFLLFALAAGLAFSYAAQPDETVRLFEQMVASIAG
jgi:hypothetical protein